MSLRTLVIPSEIKRREFDAKLLLACVAAAQGFSSIIGSRVEIHNAIAKFPGCVYLGKDVRRSSARIFSILKDLGSLIFILDEESLLYYTPQYYYRRRVSPEAMRYPDFFFAWGEDSAKVLRGAPGFGAAEVVPTGSPRLDLCRPEHRHIYAAEAAAIRERFGEFVLINTSFGLLNPFYEYSRPTIPANTEEERAFDEHSYAFRSSVFRDFLDMVPALAKARPDRQIVVRPHPAESPDVWEEAVQGLSNVAVASEGSVAPWLLASSLAIHNNCHTAIEATVLGTPCIAHLPKRDPVMDFAQTNDVSVVTEDLEQLVAAVDRLFAGAGRDAETYSGNLEKLSPFVSGLTGPTASSRIVSEISRVLADGAHGSQTTVLQKLHGNVHANARAIYRGIKGKVSENKTSEAYTRQRFPETTLDEVRRTAAQIMSAEGNELKVEISQVEPNVFRVSPTA
jgi:surface carbohydrate biosynthesis protein